MSFTQTVIAQTAELCGAIRAMPFNRELAEGSLCPQVFRHYMIQDAHYLEGFARALAMTSARAPDADSVRQLAQSAAGAISVERQMHEHYLGAFGVSAADFAATPRSPACDHYVNILIATAATQSAAVSLAALLPCYWIYRDVGRDMSDRLCADNPFQAWIDTYSGASFDAAVAQACALADRLALRASAREYTQMEAAYQRSALMEWRFWESAYRREGWPDPIRQSAIARYAKSETTDLPCFDRACLRQNATYRLRRRYVRMDFCAKGSEHRK